MKNNPIIVTPVYEDVQSAEKLIEDLNKILENNYFLVAVDDGSLNEPFEINTLKKLGTKGVVLKLIKNVGHQKAIAIGLQYVANEISWAQEVIVMDSDGEDKPINVKGLLEGLKKDKIDIVVAERSRRSESMGFVLFYKIYKAIFRVFTGRTINFGNFMAIKIEALNRIVNMPELWTHLAATTLYSKLRITGLESDRGIRYFGQSKHNFISFALHGFKALMIFSEEVLVRVGVACALIASFALLGSMIAIALKFVGIATPGWFSVVMGIFILVFLQTGTLTLISLLLNGIVRNNVQQNFFYKDFLDEVFPSNQE